MVLDGCHAENMACWLQHGGRGLGSPDIATESALKNLQRSMGDYIDA